MHYLPGFPIGRAWGDGLRVHVWGGHSQALGLANLRRHGKEILKGRTTQRKNKGLNFSLYSWVKLATLIESRENSSILQQFLVTLHGE
jgi:hypothetical protein